jgi:hypothetical protein
MLATQAHRDDTTPTGWGQHSAGVGECQRV